MDRTMKAGGGRQPDRGVQHLMRQLLEAALREDLGFGDLSGSLLSGEATGDFLAKEDGVLAGTQAIPLVYELLGGGVEVSLSRMDGQPVRRGNSIATVEGPVETLLAGERVILNLLQHLSGIATATSRAAQALQGSTTRICDTRKTIPGLRALQKYAVRCGGGFNHRYRLDDGVMIKDNHIVAAGGIANAVRKARERTGPMIRIEVECETAVQVEEAIAAGADVIMLDNKTPDEVINLRKLIPDEILVELSGGITPAIVGDYRDCGADYISIGSLTHSVQALDISFNLSGGWKQEKQLLAKEHSER